MVNFFKKFMGDSTRGQPCKECGHGEASHHLKITEEDQRAKEHHSEAIRLNCRECDCKQFR